MEYLHIQSQSGTAKIPVPLEVLVPEKDIQGPYKTLFLLHDFGGNNLSWLRHSNIEDRLDKEGCIIVMPSCLNSFYVNMYYGYDMFDYITSELVELSGRWFHTNGQRIIAGIGMGGYGAVHAGLCTEHVFDACISINGMLAPDRFYDDPLPTVNMEDIFGPRGYFERSNSKLENALQQYGLRPEERRTTSFILTSSASDPFRKEAQELHRRMEDSQVKSALYLGEDLGEGLAEPIQDNSVKVIKENVIKEKVMDILVQAVRGC